LVSKTNDEDRKVEPEVVEKQMGLHIIRGVFKILSFWHWNQKPNQTRVKRYTWKRMREIFFE